jgi:hypothetical protein
LTRVGGGESEEATMKDAKGRTYAGLSYGDEGYIVTHYDWVRKNPSLVRLDKNGTEEKIIASFRSVEDAHRFRDWLISLRPDARDAT